MSKQFTLNTHAWHRAPLIAMLVFWIVTIGSLVASLRVHSTQLEETWGRQGLNGIAITAVLQDAAAATNRLYASSRDTVGVYLSEDNGQTWQPYDPGLTNKNIESLAACPSGWLFAGSWGDGVYRRQLDNAWQSKNTNLTQPFIAALACGTANTIFAATANHGVFRSLNNGDTWAVVNNGLTQLEIYTLKYTNSKLFAGSKSGIFMSVDDASTWQSLGLENRQVYSILVTDIHIWAGTDQGVFRTELANVTPWQAIGTLGQVVYALVSDGDERIYAGTSAARVFRYQDNSWQDFNASLQPVKIFSLLKGQNNSNSLFAGTEDGVWRNLIQPRPTPTPTSTATPTPIPTPTPGIQSIRLRNEPQGELLDGDEVTYTIEVQNGTFPLTDLVVSNVIPEQMELTTDSIQAPVAWTTDVADRTISWLFSSLPASSTVTLLYRAQRHTPTATPTATNTDVAATPTATETPTSTPSPTATEGQTTSTPTATATQTATPTASSVAETPTASPTSTVTATPTATSTELTITKSGPAAVPVGANIVYTLTVTNPLTRSLTGLTIFDLVPVGSEVVNFGGGSTTMPPSQMIQWQVPLLNANSFVTRTFAIQLTMSTSQIRNELYFVDVIANGELVMRAVGEAPVVTTIDPPSGIDQSALLGVATPPATNPPIINAGALAEWVYPGFSGQQLSNSVRNPFQLYLPVIQHQ